MFQYSITNTEFTHIQKFIFDNAAITLSDDKHSLVVSRLSKRLRHHNIKTFQDYYDLVVASPLNGERQVMIDLLTTNETYFFREPKHFSFLERIIIPGWGTQKKRRIWSAASSTGEEAYSIAMLLDDRLGASSWEIFGSDISRRVLEKAEKALYQTQRIEGIPDEYLKNYCLKGTGEYEGSLLVEKRLRDRVSFALINLSQTLPDVGLFDVIFLRNVLIYFNQDSKQKVVKNLVDKLTPGGYFFVGHSESLKGICDSLTAIAPAIYQKPFLR